MFALMDDMATDAVRVSADPSGSEIRIVWGATTVKLSITEAVDLVDAVATVLGELPAPPKPLARDESRVRAAADVREAL